MLKKFILNSNNIMKTSFIWNAYAAMLNSFQTTVLLVVLTRMGTDAESSAFVIAYAIANLLLHVGKFGIRQFQVTDVNEKYSYKEYKDFRIILVVFMMVCSFVYAGFKMYTGTYDLEKAIIVLMICSLRAIEAFEDVIHGRLQQIGRLDIGAKILSIRLTVYAIGFIVLYAITKNLTITCGISLVAQGILAIVLNSMVAGTSNGSDKTITGNKKKLFFETLPLGIAMITSIYISNSPKYIIDGYVSDEIQTNFNIVFMPVFVVAMLAGFIYQPLVKNIGHKWSEGRVSDVNKDVSRLCILTSIVVVLVVLCAYVLGIPVLEMVYGVDLELYKNELLLLTFTGGIIALQNIFIILITMIRKQKLMLYGYLVIAGGILLLGKSILKEFNIIGLCIFFMSALLMLLIYFVSIYLLEVRKTKRGNYDFTCI